MDIVITYVDGNDSEWRQAYEKYTDKPLLDKRFRDWGTLKYLMRGIEKNMPFIRNVYLVVSGESQVPDWVNRENLRIVLHSDIIPEKLLPTFNCNPIELHLQNIKGLDEKYLYFNDDIFPVLPCEESDFYDNGKVCIGFSRHILSWGMFKKITKLSDTLARKALGMKPSCCFVRPQHICTPMLKTEVEAVYSAVKDEIIDSLTTVREAKNANQYLFLDYMYYKGKAVNRKISRRHISMGMASPDKIAAEILHPSAKLLCINDVEMSDEKFSAVHEAMNAAFEAKFPSKSKYEL